MRAFVLGVLLTLHAAAALAQTAMVRIEVRSDSSPVRDAAVVINGKLAGCCAGRGPDEHVIRQALQ